MPSMGGPQAGDNVSGEAGGPAGSNGDTSIGSGGTIGKGPGQPGSYADTISGQVSTTEGLGPGSFAGGTIGVESMAEAKGLSPSQIADMVNAGMNPDNPVDLAIAKAGIAIGLPPDPAKARPSTVMGVFAHAIPGAMTMMNVSKAISQKGLTGGLSTIAGKMADSMMASAVPGYGLATTLADMMGYETPGNMMATEMADALGGSVTGQVTDQVAAGIAGPGSYSPSTSISENMGNEEPYWSNTRRKPTRQAAVPAYRTPAEEVAELSKEFNKTLRNPNQLMATYQPDFKLLETSPFDFLEKIKNT